MKIALIMSGHLRCYKDCFESLKSNVIDSTNCDVFMQFYSSPETDNALSLYNPKKYLISEEQEPVPFTVHPVCRIHKAPETNVDGVFSMWNNIKKSFDLVDGDYDYVIKARYDIKFSTPLDLKFLNTECINIPEGGNWRGGVFDMFAVSSYENMKYYCEMINCMNRYTVDEQVPFHPETLLKYHLENRCINRFPFPVYLRKIYDRGIIEDRIFTI